MAAPEAEEQTEAAQVDRRLAFAKELGKLPHDLAVQFLEANPAVQAQIGDLASQARTSFARALAPKNAAFRISLERTAREVRADVAGASPSPLERLLADRIATTWLELHMLDLVVAQEVKPGLGPLDPEAVEAADRRRGRAHKRYLAAIHELAVVRRLLVPSVRVHIDQRRQAERPRALPVRTT